MCQDPDAVAWVASLDLAVLDHSQEEDVAVGPDGYDSNEEMYGYDDVDDDEGGGILAVGTSSEDSDAEDADMDMVED